MADNSQALNKHTGEQNNVGYLLRQSKTIMKNCNKRKIPLLFLYVTAIILMAPFHCQSCRRGGVTYFKRLSDKTIEDEQNLSFFTSNAVSSPSNCLVECSRRLGQSCVAFIFNQVQQRCRGYKTSLISLTQLPDVGTVGYGKKIVLKENRI